MPQIVEPLRDQPEPTPNRIRWTRSQCDAIRNAGVLTGRYELIDGEIISKMGQKPPHSVALTLVLQYLVAVFGALFVRIQTTIDVANADPLYNEPEPDAAVTTAPATSYVDRHPGPEDLRLVVEIADSTLRFDRTVKASLYARAGIAEYWVLDIPGRSLYVHRDPGPDGYGQIVQYREGETVGATAWQTTLARVADLLPPA